MSMQAALDGISNDVKAALDEAAEAYDNLVHTLDEEGADLKAVLSLSGQIWSSSLKAWAQLVLAPATIAAAITSGGTDDAPD
jgi:hypothetical protein